jgi:hypothetical protein
VREQLIAAAGSSARLPIIRGRTAPNILFITLSPQDKADAVAKALSSFANRCPKVEVFS